MVQNSDRLVTITPYHFDPMIKYKNKNKLYGVIELQNSYHDYAITIFTNNNTALIRVGI